MLKTNRQLNPDQLRHKTGISEMESNFAKPDYNRVLHATIFNCGMTMAIFEFQSDQIIRIPETSFDQSGLRERHDLQRLLRAQIDVVLPDTLIIAEEFGEWTEDSRRRIDLLGIDKDANLVVIELKRNEDGGHMDLQAIRYAAMVSTMTFDKVVELYRQWLVRRGSQSDARQSLLSFLGWDRSDENVFGQDIRIVLVSADFSKELTTAVMWLNERNLDIRCIRLKPYKDGERLLVDVQQVIPLPEAIEYQVQIREKEQKVRQERVAERFDHRRDFWEKLLNRPQTLTNLYSNVSSTDYPWLMAGSGMRGLAYRYTLRKDGSGVGIYIDRGPGSASINRQVFEFLFAYRERIEGVFGEPLVWERPDDQQACTISFKMTKGGWGNDPSIWPAVHDEMIDRMSCLEKAINPLVPQLKTIPSA